MAKATGQIEWSCEGYYTTTAWRGMTASIEESDRDYFWHVYRADPGKPPVPLKETTNLGLIDPKSIAEATALCEAVLILNAIADGQDRYPSAGGLYDLAMICLARMTLGRMTDADERTVAENGRAWEAHDNKLAKARRKTPYGR